MAQIVIRNIPDDIMDGLKIMASKSNTSTEQQVRTLISEAVEQERRLQLFRTEVARAREAIQASRGTLSDSADLIREDRQR